MDSYTLCCRQNNIYGIDSLATIRGYVKNGGSRLPHALYSAVLLGC